MKIWVNSLLLMLLFTQATVAAPRGEGSDQLFGQWTTAFINGRFGKDSPWIYMGEAGIRSSTFTTNGIRRENGYDIGSVPLRAGVGYQIDRENSVMIGYLYQYSQPPYAKTDINENRAWQQYQNVQDFTEWGKLQNRVRFEQRTITEGDGVALRGRYQIKYSYPLNKDWGLVLSEEVFWNMNTVSWGPVAGFDQNRIFVGPSYQFNRETKMEFGYMNNYVNKDTNDDLNSHVFVMNFYYQVPD